MEGFIKNLAKGAGKILREGFRTKFKINHKKGFWDVVTKYDLASNQFITDRIKRKYPSHGIISEEAEHAVKEKNFWVIDPLDGTRNFSLGIPVFCVSIAFVSGNRTLYGAVYDPAHDELFFGRKGTATLNGLKIRVANTKSLEFSLGSVECNVAAVSKKFRAKLQKIVVEHQIWNAGILSGALSPAYVAAGRCDISIDAGEYPWDYAAGVFIAQQAGAKATTIDGSPYRWDSNSMVGANPVLYKKIMEALKNANI